MKTGYGQQAALWCPVLAAAGHEVTISSFAGLQGRELEWEGLKILPGSREAHGNDFLGVRAAHWLHEGGPGLVFILCDTWTVNPAVIRGAPVAMWTPVDCEPMGAGDRAVLERSGAAPVAVSEFGRRMMRDAGMEPLYIPHAVDLGVFAPADRAEARKALGFPESAFIIGFNGANSDSGPSRKAIPQQLRAFAAFRKNHKDALMALHTRMDGPDGAVHIHELAARLGILDSLLFSDQVRYWEGAFPQEYLALFYSAADVLTATSFGEGFGLPLLEAQACGTPVVTSDHSAMRELCGAGWLVGGDPWWQNDHLAWWHCPRVDLIRRAYGKAYTSAAGRREEARVFATRYEPAVVMERYWKPALAELERRLVTTASGDDASLAADVSMST